MDPRPAPGMPVLRLNAERPAHPVGGMQGGGAHPAGSPGGLTGLTPEALVRDTICVLYPATQEVDMINDKPSTRLIPFLAGLVILAALLLAGCASTPSDNVRIAEARASLLRFVDSDPGLQGWVDHAHGYAVFPSVGKGGFWVGGAYGRGIVFERGEPVGRTRIIQGTIGAQIGAQNFAQVIFFQDEVALRNFQRGNYEFSAQATAVAATSGAATTTSYDGGVAVFILAKSGLMAEASVGGQKFEYEAL